MRINPFFIAKWIFEYQDRRMGLQYFNEAAEAHFGELPIFGFSSSLLSDKDFDFEGAIRYLQGFPPDGFRIGNSLMVDYHDWFFYLWDLMPDRGRIGALSLFRFSYPSCKNYIDAGQSFDYADQRASIPPIIEFLRERIADGTLYVNEYHHQERYGRVGYLPEFWRIEDQYYLEELVPFMSQEAPELILNTPEISEREYWKQILKESPEKVLEKGFRIIFIPAPSPEYMQSGAVRKMRRHPDFLDFFMKALEKAIHEHPELAENLWKYACFPKVEDPMMWAKNFYRVMNSRRSPEEFFKVRGRG